MKLGKKLCKTLRKSFSLVLAFTMMLSVCAVSGMNLGKVAAAESKTLYYMNTNGWGSVYAYTWTSSTKYSGDWPGTSMDKLSNVKHNVYKITVDAEAENIIFSDGNGAQTGEITIPSSSNMIYNNGTWSEYSETVVEDKVEDKFEYDAKIDSSFPDSIYLASCSYYDYLDDQELSTQWGNVKTAGNSATWYPFDNFNSYLSQYYEDNNVKKPLYYGNFNTGTAGESDRKDTYDAKKGSLYGYDAAANNSKAVWHDIKTTNIDVNNTNDLAGCSSPDSWSWSYQGIVSKDLSSDGSLMMMKNDNSGTVAAPFFSDSFLSQSAGNNTYGKKVNAALPFTYDSNTKKYSYQSSTVNSHANPVNSIYLKNANTGSSTNNLNGVTSDSLTLMYGGSDTSKAIHDGKLWFNSGESGYGFFPFNNNTINHTGKDVRNDLNYGFGMALSVDFTVPEGGKIDDQDVTFTFTGDDDVWIYIDGKLVVDLGGDHKDASCTLNFAKNSTTYATGLNSKSVTSASSVYSLSDVMNGSTKNTVHKLQMFYMERGLIESNLQVEFSFTPVDNKLTTTKTVNTVNVNDGIKDAVAAADTFTFTNVNNSTANSGNSALSYKEYLYTDKTGSTSSKTSDANGSYAMKDGDSSSFTNITNVGNWLTVAENMTNSFIKYSSTYSVTDVNNGIQKGSGSGTSANFLFKNEVNEKNATDYKVDFVNTPKLSNLDVSKSAFDKDGNPITNVSYNFTVYLSFDGGTTYNQYPLDYTINGAEYAADNGTFALKGGETAVFPNIPVGTMYKIVEEANSDYTVSSVNSTGTVTDNGATAQFTNKQIDKSNALVTLSAAKTLDGETPDVNTFEFTLTEMKKSGSALTESKLLQTKNNFGDKITFDALEYEYRGVDTPTTTQPVTDQPTVAPTTAKPTVQSTTAAPTTTPVNQNTVYLKPNSNWKADSARFAIYVFNDSVSPKQEQWVSMADDDGDGYYQAEIPSGTWKGLIFCRMNPSSSTNSWETKWNQTDNLSIPSATDTNRCYTIADGAWDKGGGSWGAAPSTTRSLAKAQTAEPVEANGGAGVNASATVDKFYYQIAEKNLGGDTYTFDTAKYYAVVSVDRTTAPNTATVKYYPTAKDAIDETNEIANPTENVKFNNYHKGSIEISKSDANGSTFQDMAGQVEFSLYKLDSPSDKLTSNNLVETKAIDDNGIVKFEDLLIFKGQNKDNTSEHQLYCFVETKAAPGYNISSEKHFFTVPYAQQCESGEEAEFAIGGVGFKYLPDSDGKMIYHIKAGTVNNYPLTMPQASGAGMNGYVVLGLSVAGLAATMFMGYTIYDRRSRKKRRARYRK